MQWTGDGEGTAGSGCGPIVSYRWFDRTSFVFRPGEETAQMCRRFAIESLDLFDVLEQKLSMSSLVAGPTQVVVDDPVPDPESDPGDLPTDEPPILVPPIPPSGPVGPG